MRVTGTTETSVIVELTVDDFWMLLDCVREANETQRDASFLYTVGVSRSEAERLSEELWAFRPAFGPPEKK